MSRAYNARRKAKRRQARAAAEPTRPSRLIPYWKRFTAYRPRFTALVPILLIAAIFAVVGVLGFGTSGGISKAQVAREVTGLLGGIPQKGAVLGSPKAPITVTVYADLECPTVRLFVEKHLPSFVTDWVRNGDVKIAYRSLQTDTSDEQVFFKQEAAALAAGRQHRMWNFLLTFVRQQGDVRTDYATEEFIREIASQVPSLELPQWSRDREDALLSKHVALGVYAAHTHGFHSTPSFLISYSGSKGDRPDDPVAWASMKSEVEASLQRDLDAVLKETRKDFPTLKVTEPAGLDGLNK